MNLTSPAILADPNGNNDSGYAPSNMEETALHVTPPNSPHRKAIEEKVPKVLHFFIIIIITEKNYVI